MSPSQVTMQIGNGSLQNSKRIQRTPVEDKKAMVAVSSKEFLWHLGEGGGEGL